MRCRAGTAVRRRLVDLGLAKAPAGSRLHAVAERGIPTRDIAEATGRAFGLPVTSIAPDDVPRHFGWIGTFFTMDLAATSTLTKEPEHPGRVAAGAASASSQDSPPRERGGEPDRDERGPKRL
jgi:hypothetical protein